MAAGGRDADADEQPRSRGRRAPRGPRRLRRHRSRRPVLGGVRRDRPHAEGPRRRRDAPGPVREAGRRVPHPRDGPARPDLERDARAEVGRLGHLPRARARRPHDVRPDDGGLVDLHRDPGDPAGHLRDPRRVRHAAVRRHARGHDHAHRRARGDGRSPAARGHDERRRGDLHRGRSRRGSSGGSRPATSIGRPTSVDEALAWAEEAKCRARAALDRAARELRGRGARPARARLPARDRDGPDERARSARRVRAGRAHPRGGLRRSGSATRRSTSGGRSRRWRGTWRRWSGSSTPAPSSSTTGTTSARAPRRAVSSRAYDYPGLRAGVRPSDVLRGQGAVPVGGALRRPGGHREDGPGGRGAVPGGRAAAAVARHGGGARGVPGAPRPDLLARVRAAREGGAAVQRDGGERRAVRADRDRPRPPRQRIGRVAVPGDRGA